MGRSWWHRGKYTLFLALALAVGCDSTHRRPERGARDAAADDAAADCGGDLLPDAGASTPDADAGDAATQEDSGSDTDATVDTDAQVPERELVTLPSGALGPCAFETLPTAPETPNANCEDGVYKGNIRINKPADIDKLRGCVRVRGNVDVEPGPLTDLRGLEALRVIEGNLTIHGTDCLCECGCTKPPVFASARGLDNLRCVSGALDVNNRKEYSFADVSFKKLAGFGSLIEVGGAMSVDIRSIEDRDAFQSLQRVWGSMSTPNSANRLILPHLQVVFGDAKLGLEQPMLEYSCDGTRVGPCHSQVIGCSYTASTDAELARVADCAIAMRDLTVGTDIHDLTPLRELKDVRGTLTLTGAISHAGQPIADFSALPKLARTSRLVLRQLPAVTNLSSLQLLSELDGLVLNDLDALVALAPLHLSKTAELEVSGNAALTNLDGLATTNMLGAVILDDNAVLSQLNALGDLEFPRRVVLRKLPALSSLSGLAKLWQTGALEIEDCDALSDLDDLTDIKTATKLRLVGNASLQSLWSTGPRQIEECDITDNSSLTSIAGMHNTRKASLARLPVLASFDGTAFIYVDLRVEACDALQDLSGLESVNSDCKSIALKNNANLTSLDGLDLLRKIESISLIGNPKLADVDGLANLTGLMALRVEHNPMLTSLDGLRNIDSLGGWWSSHLWETGISIIDNDALTNLDGLGGRQELSGLLHIEGNDGLVDLRGLEDLEAVREGTLKILNNDGLTSLSGLQNLGSPNGAWLQLEIADNAALTTLHDLTSLAGALVLFRDNPSLPQCEVQWLAMRPNLTVDGAANNGPTGPCTF